MRVLFVELGDLAEQPTAVAGTLGVDPRRRAQRQPPATPPDPCPPLAANEVSDDETPSIAGASGKTVAGPWLEARGITKAAFRAWVRARDPKFLEDFDADSVFDYEGHCRSLTVGDKREDALVCTFAVRTSIMRDSAAVFVVRNKRIVSVLDVGFALRAMDWPVRWLDLQLTFSASGLEADLHDRAKPDTLLVMPPRVCHEHFERYLACEKAHRDGVLSETTCPAQTDASGKLSFGHMTPTPGEDPILGGPIELFGCDKALEGVDRVVQETKSDEMFAGEYRDGRTFAMRSCKARGHYVWKGDRFVRAPTPSH